MNYRHVFAIALLAIAALTLIVFVVSQFIQPILPKEVNSGVLLLMASLLGVMAFLASLNEISDLVNKVFGGNGEKTTNSPSKPPDLLKPAQTESEAPVSESIRPQLSLRFDVLEPPSVYSSYGLVYAGGVGACPPVTGHASLGLVLVNNSLGRSAKYIKARLDVQMLRSTCSECNQDFNVPTSGWRWSEIGKSTKHFHFDGGLDDVCIHEDELSLGVIEFRFTLPKGAVNFMDLVQESDDLQTRTFLKLQFDSPTQFPQMPILHERLLSLYDNNPAEDSYKLTYKVGAEGFVQFSDEVSVLITWSRHKGRVAVE